MPKITLKMNIIMLTDKSFSSNIIAGVQIQEENRHHS